MKKNFTQFVHEYEDENGVTRYAVAAKDEVHHQYWRPMTKAEKKANGDSSAVWVSGYNAISYLGGYTDRRKALRQARQLFGYVYDPATQDVTR